MTCDVYTRLMGESVQCFDAVETTGFECRSIILYSNTLMHDKDIDQRITTVDVSTSIFLQKTFRLHNFPFSDRATHASNAHVRTWQSSHLIYALILEMHCCACI